MTALVAAALMVSLLVVAWNLGRILETVLPRFPVLARRLTYTFLAYELVRVPVERLIRVLL